MRPMILHSVILSALAIAAAPAARAEVIGGVDFPQGPASFADQVISYAPDFSGGAVPAEAFRGAANALGAPDYAGSCTSQADCTFVSLGDGGRVVFRFTNNVLTGSNSAADDLWVFEIGPDVEDTFVDVSSDGINWLSVGAVTGGRRGVDLDAFGYDATSSFSFVRLTDDGALDDQTGASVGADIDAVGAISTRIVSVVPEPGSWALMLAGFAAVGVAMRRRPSRVGASALCAGVIQPI